MSTPAKPRKPSRGGAKEPFLAAAVPAGPSSRPGANYADGTPFDDVTYLEAKLILKPEPFTSVQRFRDFARYVRRIARRTDVSFIEDKSLSERPDAVPGALVVLLAFFGPTAILTFMVGRGWRKLEAWPWRRSIERGLAPVSIGLMLAGCFTMAKGAIFDLDTAAIAVGVLAFD